MITDRRIALYVLCTGMLMIVLDVTVVNVALPSIQSDLGFSSSSLAWVVNAYLIAFGGLLLLAGRLGDTFGRRRVFLSGIGVFSLASLVCGLSQNALMLELARFVQGAGGALTSSVILGMIVTMFTEPREQAQAIGVFAFVASAGGAVGLLAGGVLTQLINWHWIFFVNLPIGLATALLARRFVNTDEGTGLSGGLDISGAVLVTTALMLGVYTIVKPAADYGWSSGRTLGFAAAAMTLLVAFVLREAKAENPLMPLRIFRSRNVCGANIIQVLGAAGMFGTFFLGALYVQKVLHYGPLKIGFAFLPASVLMGAISVRYSDRLIARFGARHLCTFGMSCIGAALALFAFAPIGANYWLHIFIPLSIIGVGAGLCFPPLMGLAMSGATADDAGLASGLINTTGQVGGALGLAVLATMSATRTNHLLQQGSSSASALTGGYHLGFWISSALVFAGALVSIFVLRDAGDGDTPETTDAKLGQDRDDAAPTLVYG
ncbi:MFS transporter [Jatrophihabitans sp. DSM 45814]